MVSTSMAYRRCILNVLLWHSLVKVRMRNRADDVYGHCMVWVRENIDFRVFDRPRRAPTRTVNCEVIGHLKKGERVVARVKWIVWLINLFVSYHHLSYQEIQPLQFQFLFSGLAKYSSKVSVQSGQGFVSLS